MLGRIFKWLDSSFLIASFKGRVLQVLGYVLIGIIAGCCGLKRAIYGGADWKRPSKVS
jgi:hypothetical protein